MNIDKLSKLPESVLSELSEKSESSGSAENADTNSVNNFSVLSDDDIFNTAKSTDTGFIPESTPENNGSKVKAEIKQTNTGSKPLQAGSFISGDFTTNLMDSLIPALIVLAASYTGYGIDKKSFQLTEKEKQLISPAMQQYLDSLSINFNNPFYNLLFVISTVYGAKILEVLPNLKKKTAPPKDIKEAVIHYTEKAKRTKLKGEEYAKEKRSIAEMSEVQAIAYLTQKRQVSKKIAFDLWNKYKNELN